MRIQRQWVLGFIGLFLYAGEAFSGELQWKQPVNDTAGGVVAAPVFCIAASTDSSKIVPVQAVNPVPPLAPPLPSTPRVIESVPMPIPTNNPSTGATLNPSSARPGTRPAVVLPPVVPCGDQMKLKSLRSISHDIRPQNAAELPPECALDSEPYTGRHFAQTCFQWHASALCTKGAYFEDVQLERYGHTACPILQPVVSGAKFLATVPLLPYKMGVTPPTECVYTLGHYRVGSCSPYMIDPFPISIRGALFEAGAVTGAILAVP